jgi:hypothetical protein
MMMSRTLTVAGLASVCALTVGSVAGAPASSAEDLHHVRYTITSETPWLADIYYHDTDPPNWAIYSHDPYVYSPKVEAQVGPGETWARDVMLADPQQWAMVVATSGLDPVAPNFRCTLEVDGAVVKTSEGPKGALCSQRTW